MTIKTNAHDYFRGRGGGVAFNESVDLFFERCPQYFLCNFVCLDAKVVLHLATRSSYLCVTSHS